MSLEVAVVLPTADFARLFAALGETTRLALLDRLASAGELPIRRLTDGSGITRQAVTKHLEVLADAGLVKSRRRGRETLYEIEAPAIDAARARLDRISAAWDDALGRLKAFVEDE